MSEVPLSTAGVGPCGMRDRDRLATGIRWIRIRHGGFMDRAVWSRNGNFPTCISASSAPHRNVWADVLCSIQGHLAEKKIHPPRITIGP